MTEFASPGWYSEPGSGRQRWWSGSTWGDYAASSPPAAASAGTVASTSGTNGLAVAALVLGILWGYGLLSILAIIFGAIGLNQTRQRNQGGRGLAMAGLILGIVGAAGALILIIAAATASNSGTTY
jgi:hypothetical protein